MEAIESKEKIYSGIEDIPVLESHDPELSSSGITILQLKQKQNEYLEELQFDDVIREADAMEFLYKLYKTKFPWAPLSLVKSFSIYHYDRAIKTLPIASC